MVSLLSQARQSCRQGDLSDAEKLIAEFARQTLDLDCAGVQLRADEYSLNSLSGILILSTPSFGEHRLFFKYHQEEDESKGVTEYYNSKLLEQASLPVDVPLAARSVTGEQILLYRERTTPRLADVCRDLERGFPTTATFDEIVAAQRELDRIVGEKYLETIHPADRQQAAAESLHQLFFYRLVDGTGQKPRAAGGRLKSYYIDQDFTFPGLPTSIPWHELAALRWRINGKLYHRSLGELFAQAAEILAPANLPDPCPAVLGHGDAHNANVWCESGTKGAHLVWFDPAFAGAHLPALLAEIKATFHNIFAHPDWLYHPRDAAAHLHAEVNRNGDVLEMETDWQPGALRAAFLESKETLVWRPLLQRVKTMQPEFSATACENYLRAALFCCPTLVMNLRVSGGAHVPVTSAVGFAVAVMCGSPCEGGDDLVSNFLRRILL